LLRVLLLWLGSLPAHPTGRGALLHSVARPTLQGLARQHPHQSNLMAWWVPTALIVAGLLVVAPLRTGIWVAALAWMGLACLLNARRSGRTHVLPADDSARVGARDDGYSALRLASVGSVRPLG